MTIQYTSTYPLTIIFVRQEKKTVRLQTSYKLVQHSIILALDRFIFRSLRAGSGSRICVLFSIITFKIDGNGFLPSRVVLPEARARLEPHLRQHGKPLNIYLYGADPAKANEKNVDPDPTPPGEKCKTGGIG